MELTNELYNKHKGTIYKACRKYFRACPNLEFDELLSQAHMIFCNSAASFDDSKGAKFNSWLTTQLQRLSENITKECGINDIQGVRTMGLSLDFKEDDSDADTASFATLCSSKEYSDKVSEYAAGDSWEDRIPEFERYFDKMSDDAKQLFNDILDGYLYPDSKQASSMGRKAFLKSASDITALQMFKRRYSKLGWRLNKVVNARNELESMLKQYKGNKIPCKLVRKIEEYTSEPLF